VCENPIKYVAYLRVSDRKQGAQGLGIEAQQNSVARYAEATNGVVISTFTEVETAWRSNIRNRPQLAGAIAHAKRAKATLLIARLDRLARSVIVTTQLVDSGVELVAVDAPYANRFTLQILACVAEAESRSISERTRAATQAAIAEGRRFGASRETLAKATAASVAARRQRRLSARSRRAPNTEPINR
jgi:DNA invertase Pin-like site-specific DNA recombinase